MFTKTRTFGVALLLAALGTLAGATGAGAQTAAPGAITPFTGEFHQIENVNDGECLQPQEPAGGNTPIVQMPCDGSSEQGWALLNMGNNHYRFLNPDGSCLDVLGGTVANNVPVVNGECEAPGQNTVSNAEWNSGTPLPDVVTLRTRLHFVDNNFCLDVPGGSSAAGLAVQIFVCNGTLAQRWAVGFN